MILITGGCGYIGSHIASELLNQGESLIILDNLSNSPKYTIERIKQISNEKKLIFIKGDLNDADLIINIFKKYKITGVYHLAGLKSVSESIEEPLKYYLNNVSGTVKLLNTMERFKVYKLIFSSSATVYDSDNKIPWNEISSTIQEKHPYAQSKIIIENLLRKIATTKYEWKIGVLRYFNPIGAHQTGLIGEFKIMNNSNLMPSIIRAYLGHEEFLSVYGGDFDTKDGTGVRDYIHINDLIDGHIKAYSYINNNNGFFVWNLGSGKGYSVLEVIDKCSEIFMKKINYKIVTRRKGDLGEYWSNINKSKKDLNWKPKKNLKNMIIDSYKFITKNKNNLC